MQAILRGLFLAIWFGGSLGWMVGAFTSLTPADIMGDAEVSSRRTLDTTLLPDTACTGFGRDGDADACRAISRNAHQRELLLHGDQSLDMAAYLAVVIGPIPIVLIIGLLLTAKWGRKRRGRKSPVNLDTMGGRPR